MKKKNLFTLMLVALLAFTLGMGTLAYYTKTFASNNNIVRAAKFTVGSNGTLDKNVEFDLTGDPLVPGQTKELYEFEIHKNDTEVPVEYDVTVDGKGKLLSGDTPVELNTYRKTGEGWNLYDGDKFKATEDIERFKIEAVWEHGDNDIAYQNATGKVDIKVVATQVDGELDPEVKLSTTELIIVPDPVTRVMSVGLKVDISGKVENITSYGATVEFNGKTYSPEKQLLGDKGIMVLYELDGNLSNPFPEKATIRLYNDSGQLVHTFTNVLLEKPKL